MNKEHKKLYDEWKKLENRLHRGIIYSSDALKVIEIRPRVWEELKGQLSADERFELGSRLEKPLREIFVNQKYPPDDWPLSKQWATGAIYRASGGLNFLMRCLEYIHRGSTDPAYSRSAYILLSYYSELLLAAYLLLKDEHSGKTKNELLKLLRGTNNKYNHDLEYLSDKIGKADLNDLGISFIKSETKNDLKRYVITLMNGEKIIVEDSVTVRYDFKYDRKRDIDLNESKRMKREVDHLLKMTYKMMGMLPR